MKEPIKFSIHGPMISGQGEQAIRKYKKIVGKRATWYIAIQENSADNIYCQEKRDSSKDYFQGFGGATLHFELEDGTIDDVKGPWHSNNESLFEDTGYDLKDKHLTRGIVALKKSGDYRDEQYEEVLHYDENPVIGTYERVQTIAQEFANKLGQDVYYAMKSSGGGSSCMIKPKVKILFHEKFDENAKSN